LSVVVGEAVGTFAAVGDSCVDVYPEHGVRAVGGQAANVAAGWARDGVRSEYVGPIGSDEDAGFVLQALHEAGVGIEHVRHTTGPTGVTMITLTQDGERVFGHSDPGVGDAYQPLRRELAAIGEDTRWVHLANVHSLSRAVDDVREVLPDAGVSYDLSDDWRSEHGPVDLRGVDVAIFSWTGALDADAEALAGRFLDAGAGLVVATAGAYGSLARQPDRTVRQPALETVVVDTCGAGDAFTSRLILEHVRGRGLDRALQAGAEAGAWACGFVGSFPQAQSIRTTS
jgi:fructoselysine 6-kinase